MRMTRESSTLISRSPDVSISPGSGSRKDAIKRMDAGLQERLATSDFDEAAARRQPWRRPPRHPSVALVEGVLVSHHEHRRLHR